jgi:alkylation response protein AidB-like acyl-CoA dehydrogenase
VTGGNHTPLPRDCNIEKVFMNFELSNEQEMLRDNVRAFLQKEYAFDARREASRSSLGWRPDIWRSFAGPLGILGLSFPERVGGWGGDRIDTMVVMEEMGSVLVLEPYLETIVICGGILSRVGGARADEALRRIATGEEVAAFAWAEPNSRYDFSLVSTLATRDDFGWRIEGVKSVATAGPWASSLIVTARSSGTPGERTGISLFLVDKSTTGIDAVDYPTIDGRRASDFTFDRVRLPPDALLGEEGKAIDLVEQVADEAIAALGAEAVGIMSRLLRDTIDYTRQRRQFGRPISEFQVLQHRMVDMHMAIEMARSATYLVTLKLAAPANERALAASAAKVTVANACRFVGQNAIQLHGAMGMTDEIPLGDYFKRATVIEMEFGSADYHLARYAKLNRGSES